LKRKKNWERRRRHQKELRTTSTGPSGEAIRTLIHMEKEKEVPTPTPTRTGKEKEARRIRGVAIQPSPGTTTGIPHRHLGPTEKEKVEAVDFILTEKEKVVEEAEATITTVTAKAREERVKEERVRVGGKQASGRRG